ncbi:MAG: hypothetical protein ACRYG4_24435 [Janthinobacterium lividum]
MAVVPPGLRGFRSATFGMTKAQVLAAITTDFGSGIRTVESSNPVEGTQIIQAPLSSLEPGPGAATIAYIFGASSKRLSNIIVTWSLQGEPNAEQRAAIVTGGMQLGAYFQSTLSPAKVSGLTPTGSTSVVFYAAIDGHGSGVQIDGSGINAAAALGSGTSGVQPRGPATLRISYTLNAMVPDVFRIRPGAF